MSEYQAVTNSGNLWVLLPSGQVGQVVAWQEALDEGKWRAIAVFDGPTAVTVDERQPDYAGARFTADFYTAHGYPEQVQP